jgi:biopolymer transport protein ExbB
MAEMTKSAGAEVKTGGGIGNWFALIVTIATIVVGELIYWVVFGNSSNFVNGDPANHPIAENPGHLFGLFYKGGFLVPIAIALLLMVIVFSIERFITLAKASGSGSLDVFVQKVQMNLADGNVNRAIEECDKIKGSVGNVIKEVLRKYREVENDSRMDKEAKMASVSKALEESVALELPMLEKHLVFLATIVSIATLVGLIGTVLGMIKAFSALATAGSPDAVALATGISEALINTAMGITTSTIATIAYNYFTSRIDGLTYKMDEAGYSIVQTFAEKG